MKVSKVTIETSVIIVAVFTFHFEVKLMIVIVRFSLELEVSNRHCQGSLLESPGVSPLEEDRIELSGAEVLITVLVQKSVDYIHDMRIKFLITNPGGNLGELLSVDSTTFSVEIEHGSLQVSSTKQDIVEGFEAFQ